jgi:hypothetical protein
VYVSRDVVFDELVFPFSRHYTVSFKDYGNFVSSTTNPMMNVQNQLLDDFDAEHSTQPRQDAATADNQRQNAAAADPWRHLDSRQNAATAGNQ